MGGWQGVWVGRSVGRPVDTEQKELKTLIVSSTRQGQRAENKFPNG